jgi:murein DD-endopeptidase MepM/ murein hydrolase activator NlpD
MRFEPFSWPLSREGLRRSMSKMTKQQPSDGRWPWTGTPGLGWMLIVVGLFIGFAAGSQMRAADPGAGDPETSRVEVVGADALPDVAAAADARSEVSDERAINKAVSEPAAGNRVAGVEVSIADDSAEEVVAHYAAISIDSLPIHRSRAHLDPVESLTIVTRGEIESGESLGSSLQRQGISPGTIHLIASEMRKVFDFRRSRPGDAYRLGQDSDGRVLDFRYSQGPEESFYLAWEGTRYVVRQETAELRPQIAKIAGVVDSSFYGAVLALGEQSSLASEFARILAWDIDFSRNVHPGDEFQILYERLYRRNDDGDEIYVRPGRVLAGHYAGNVGEYTVIYFEDEQGAGAYFRPDGSSVERAFLAAPLEFSRISSRFTRARRHPILKVTRPHPGIDYAAPRGTPIWAVADGVVEYRARAGASGNLVRIRHAGGYTSHYAHLSKFASDIAVGDRVEQKQLIGYVGSTGLSTGPHVCFRVKKDGRYVDPMRIASPAGASVDEEKRPVFEYVRDQLLADLGPGPLSVVDEAL